MPYQDRAPNSRDIAAIWPCASLMMPFPIPDLGEGGDPHAEGADADASLAGEVCRDTLLARLRQLFFTTPDRSARVART